MAISFLFLFFVIFGPKLGYVDLSVVIPFALLMLQLSLRPISIGRVFLMKLVAVNSLFFINLLYLFLISSYTENYDLVSFGRLIRCTLQVNFIMLFLVSAQNLFNRNFFSWFFYLHALIILASALNYEFSSLISLWSGNEKIRLFRSSGLFAGFDIAGIVLIVFYWILYRERLVTKVTTLTFIVTLIFTSRFNIMFGFIMLTWFYRKLIIQVFFLRKGLALFILMQLIIAFCVTVILYLMNYTFSLDLPLYQAGIVNHNLSFIFARSQEGLFWSHMFFIPGDEVTMVLGSGSQPNGSDVGYTRELFRGGIVGLFIVLVTHLLLYFLLSPDRRIFWFCIFLILFFSLKNNYFYVRGVTPLLVSYCMFNYIAHIKLLSKPFSETRLQ